MRRVIILDDMFKLGVQFYIWLRRVIVNLSWYDKLANRFDGGVRLLGYDSVRKNPTYF